MTLALIGLPGSGKSTIGKAVARRLGSRFVDVDKTIEEREGCTIAELFRRNGEDAFRAIEVETLRLLVDAEPSVIATGGGIVVRPLNRELLRERTCCVYLRTGHDLLWRRLRRDTRRPLLQVADPEQRLRELAAERAPLYEQTAHLVVDTDGRAFQRIVDEVVARASSMQTTP